MSDFATDPAASTDGTPDAEQTVEDIAEDVREDIRLGHVEDDVSHVLKERLDGAGLNVSPDEVDDLAEEIEDDASR